MAADRIKDHATPTGLEGGAAGSEHEGDVHGMTNADENRQRDEKRSGKTEGRAENAQPHRESGKAAEDTPVHRLRTTSYTEMDEQAAEEGEAGLAARTPHEMSLHDELSRTPVEKNRNKESSAD